MRFGRTTLFPGALVLAIIAAGCSSASTVRPAAAPPVGVPRPAGVQDPAMVPSEPPPVDDCDRRASLRPPAELPPPGRMPSGSTMARIAKNGRLVVGVSQTTYLFGHRDPLSGELVGLDIDIAREIAKAIFGRPDRIQFWSTTSAQRIPYITSGKVDMVIRTSSMTCDRWRDVSFSSQYYQAEQRVLVGRDSTVRGLGDLGGKKVCAAAGSTDLAVVAAAKSRPVPVSAPEVIDCLVMLQLGEVEAISNDDALLMGFTAQDPNTKIVGPSLDHEAYGIMMPKGDPDLVRFVNGVLARMRADGSLASLYRRWLAPGATAPAVPAARYRD
jgi:polar amino acid transport system substrate-binding protein